MAASIPSECPTCAAGNIKSAVKLVQINLEEAAPSCENKQCKFPLNCPDVCPLVIPHKLILNPTSFEKRRRLCSFDTESLTSNSSAASWTSGASTLSSIPSSAITPPPPLQHKLSARRKGKTVVHSTAQMSPYTFRSVLEREADLPVTKMRKNSSLDTESLTSNCSVSSWASCTSNAFTPPMTPIYPQGSLIGTSKGVTLNSISRPIDLVDFDEFMGMTPSPSVAVTDDIDALLAELVSFANPKDEQVPFTEPSLNELAETLFSNEVTVNQSESVNVEDPLPKSRKTKTKPSEINSTQNLIVNQDSPLKKRNKAGPESLPTFLGIELPAKRKPTPAKKSSAPKTKASTPKTKPATAKTKRSSPKKKETVIPSESTPSEPPAPSISFQVNDDGVPVFVIPLPQPTVQEEPTKGKGSRKNRKDDLSSTTITKRSLKMLMDSRGGANALSKSPPKTQSRPRRKKSDADFIDIKSLVEKFRKSSRPIVKNSPD